MTTMQPWMVVLVVPAVMLIIGVRSVVAPRYSAAREIESIRKARARGQSQVMDWLAVRYGIDDSDDPLTDPEVIRRVRLTGACLAAAGALCLTGVLLAVGPFR
jgi:hypothetical protein